MYARLILDIPNAKVSRPFDYAVPQGMNVAPGMRADVTFAGRQVTGVVVSVSDTTDVPADKLRELTSLPDGYPILTVGQIALAERMAKKYHTPMAVALRLMYPAELRAGTVRERTRRVASLATGADIAALRASCYSKSGKVKSAAKLALIDRLSGGDALLAGLAPAEKTAAKKGEAEGWVQITSERELRIPREFDFVPQAAHTLTADQHRAISRIDVAKKGGYLLYGVTGSGKTEVYINVIERCLALGRGAILMVPEISLTPQLLRMLRERLSCGIAVLHSSLSAGERYDEWRRILSGEARVVVGARSAVFAPVENLGAIIIDEEHETSYKSDIHPKYTAHDVARMRSQIESCALVLGSATPSVETFFAARRGDYEILSMPKRLFDMPLPEIIVADMRAELAAGNRTMFSHELFSQIEQTLDMGRQTMLFINRRGYANFVLCRGCGYTEYCDRCEVTMTYHDDPPQLKCHYCGRTRPYTNVCPQCGKPYLKQFGVGTQKVEAAVREYFPQARTLRMDLDSTANRDAHLDIYSRFARGDADILIGTQMIAKGFDFAGVRLVGVVAADTGLKFPDYRSAERTFSLIEQVAGRAGRREPGVVVVQTYSPEHYAIQCAAAHDYRGFYEREVAVRRESMLPPFGTYYRVLFVGADEGRVKADCRDFGDRTREALKSFGDDVLYIETSAAPIKRVDGRYRYQVMIKAAASAALEERIFKLMEESQYASSFGLDINP